MSEKAQIDVVQGNKVIRIFSGWGNPRNILPALRAAASAGHSKALDIAREIIRQVPDASFGLRIIGRDYQHQDDLSYRYKVDVSSAPWRVAQTTMPHYKLIDNGDGTGSPEPNLTPAVTRSFRVNGTFRVVNVGGRPARIVDRTNKVLATSPDGNWWGVAKGVKLTPELDNFITSLAA